MSTACGGSVDTIAMAYMSKDKDIFLIQAPSDAGRQKIALGLYHIFKVLTIKHLLAVAYRRCIFHVISDASPLSPA